MATAGDLSGDGLARELAKFGRMVAGAAVPGEDAYLVGSLEGRVMAEGTTAPVIGSRFVTVASGLAVPERLAVGPAPLDLVQLYVTAEDLFGFTPPLSYALDNIARVTMEEIVQFCAYWLNQRHSLGADRHAVDAAFVATYFQEPVRSRALALLRDPSRALIAPQGLFVLMKLAALRSGDLVLDGVPAGNIALSYLILLDHLGKDPDDINVPHTTIVTGEAGRLGREIISNQIFHAHRDVAEAIRGFMRRWVELPVELAGHSRVVDMAASFRDATGVELADFVLLVFAMWGAANDGRPRFEPGYFAQLGWSPSRLDDVLALFVADVPHLRGGVRREASEHDLPWAIGTFERFPAVRMGDDSVLVLDPYLLGRRVLGLPPLFDITSMLADRGDTKTKKKVEGSYAHLSEVYAHELLDAVVPPDTGRRYGANEIQAAYGTASKKNADAAIDYGDGWVVVEITTSRPQRGTVSGQSDDAVSADLDKLIPKAAQLHSTIAFIRADASTLTGSPAHPHPRFHPVLVVADGFPVNPISVTLLRERLAIAGLLQQSDTAPLEVLDLEELAIIEHIQSAGGPSLRDLLAAHERSGVMGNVGLREFILVALRLQPTRGTVESDAMERLLRWAMSPSPDIAA